MAPARPPAQLSSPGHHTDKDAYLPAPLFDALREGKLWMEWLRYYERPRDAEEDLFAAWAAVTEAGIWSPRLTTSGQTTRR